MTVPLPSRPSGPRRAGRLVVRLASAVVIGVATLFTPKAQRDQHWSIPPTVQPTDAEQAEASPDDR